MISSGANLYKTLTALLAINNRRLVFFHDAIVALVLSENVKIE
jgi:hypothetical protein